MIFHKCIITSDQHIFMMWHNKRKQWEFPGGKHDEGETMKECIVREIKEEIGFTCQPQKVGPVNIVDHDDKWVCAIWHVEAPQIDFKCLEPNKHSNPTWFHVNDIPELSEGTKQQLKTIIGQKNV